MHKYDINFISKDMQSLNEYYNLIKQQNISIFSTPYFIVPSIAIYSYFTYFAFIYYVAIIISLYNIQNKRFVLLSFVLLIITFLVIHDTGSRLFIYSVYFLPVLYISYKILKISLKKYFYIFSFIVVLITLGVYFVNLDISDPSLYSRYMKIHQYFDNFTIKNLLFPFENKYRIANHASFHNEFFEIFSFFSFIIIYYYIIIKDIFCDVNKKYELISYLLMFVIVIGSLIQLNLTNPYVGIILAFL